MTHWKYRQSNGTISSAEKTRFGLTDLLCRCLEARGLTESDRLADLFGGGCALHDPLELKDMDKAVNRIRAALDAGEKIAVYGDYDADGVTATYLMTHWLSQQGCEAVTYLPDRVAEGYGLHQGAVEKLAQEGVQLLITVDCGVTAVAEIAGAMALGMDVVVTDHHEPGPVLPACTAVVDPCRKDCTYPFRGLAGVGVVMKLLCALEGDSEKILERYGEIVAVGTVADMMPMTDENRRIVTRGVEKLAGLGNPGLRTLCEMTAKGERLSAETISFRLAPRLNAAGRMGSAEDAIALLRATDRDTACQAADLLCSRNLQRQAAEAEIYNRAVSMVNAQPEVYAGRKSIVLMGQDWLHGVLGIVAARLTERYGLPAVLFARDGEGMLKGSARGVDGLDLFTALHEAVEGIGTCGGHRRAAGVSLPEEQLEIFAERLGRICAETLSQADVGKTLLIDLPVPLNALRVAEIEALERLEPFGEENPKPLFSLEATLTAITPIAQGKHLRLTVEDGGMAAEVMAFGYTRNRFRYREGDRVEMAVIPSVSLWRGNKAVKLILEDIRPLSHVREAELAAQQAIEEESVSELIFPEREKQVAVWQTLRRLNPEETVTPAVLACGIRNVDAAETLLILRAFYEAGLIDCICLNGWHCQGEMQPQVKPASGGKADLTDTEIYRKCGKTNNDH